MPPADMDQAAFQTGWTVAYQKCESPWEEAFARDGPNRLDRPRARVKPERGYAPVDMDQAAFQTDGQMGCRLPKICKSMEQRGFAGDGFSRLRYRWFGKAEIQITKTRHL
jgi:hypothetical protein